MITDYDITPPHEVTDFEKVERIARSMKRNGWLGESLLVCPAGYAWTGAHRIAAAYLTGIEVEIHVIRFRDFPTLEDEYEAAELASQIRDDDDRLAWLESYADAESARIMRKEIEKK